VKGMTGMKSYREPAGEREKSRDRTR